MGKFGSILEFFVRLKIWDTMPVLSSLVFILMNLSFHPWMMWWSPCWSKGYQHRIPVTGTSIPIKIIMPYLGKRKFLDWNHLCVIMLELRSLRHLSILELCHLASGACVILSLASDLSLICLDSPLSRKKVMIKQ